MLCLTRSKGETIVIDGRITITVVQIQGGTVRLGIDAPRDLRVNRGEIETKRAEETAEIGGSSRPAASAA